MAKEDLVEFEGQITELLPEGRFRVRLENDLATLLRTTEDRFEGAKAFLEKRKPRWQGR